MAVVGRGGAVVGMEQRWAGSDGGKWGRAGEVVTSGWEGAAAGQEHRACASALRPWPVGTQDVSTWAWSPSWQGHWVCLAPLCRASQGSHAIPKFFT